MAKILVVDDNAVIRDVVRFTLQYRHSVTQANDAEEGIRKSENCHFHMIITDINMPGMSGIELIKILRKSKKYAMTPILAITANLNEYREIIKASGATGYLLKPIDPNMLLKTIDAVFANNSN